MTVAFDDPWDAATALSRLRHLGVLEVVVTDVMFARIHKLLATRAIYVTVPGMTGAFTIVVDGQGMLVCTRDPEP